MSQLPPIGYVPQYNFWPQYLTPPEALLAPARRAGWMLVGLGALMFLLGLLGAFVADNVTDATYAKVIDQVQQANPSANTAQVTPRMFRIMYTTTGILAALMGAVMAGVGLFVRRGSMVASIFGLLVLALPLLGTALIVIVSLFTNPVEAVMSLIVLALPIALFITAGAFLIAALRNAPKVSLARQQLAMLHQQQMMQYQQAYAPQFSPPSPYGYAPQAPPPPTVAANDPPTPPPAGG